LERGLLRLKTKAWVIISVVILTVVVAGTTVSVNGQVDQQVEEARRLNGLV